MEVILLERVEKLGNVGDIVNVKNGYGRNYLIPQEKALRATAANKSLFEAKRAEIEKQNEESRKKAEADVKKLDKLITTIIQQAGEDGRLFGSVNARNIAAAVSRDALAISAKNVTVNDSVKFLGVYPVKISLHPEVTTIIHINVARSDSEAEEAKKEFLNPSKKNKLTAQELAEAEEKAQEVIDSAEEAKAENNDEEAA